MAAVAAAVVVAVSAIPTNSPSRRCTRSLFVAASSLTVVRALLAIAVNTVYAR